MNKQQLQLQVTPLYFSRLPTMAQLFSHFSQRPWAMLLDSADSDREDGRFDIMVANPLAKITTKGQQTTIYHVQGESKQQSKDNPLTIVQSCLEKYLPGSQISVSHRGKLPFMAGALGLFGYDLGKQFEASLKAPADDYSTPDMAVGIYSWSIIKDNLEQQFYLCYLDNYPHPTKAELEQCLRDEKPQPTFKLEGQWHANMNEAEYSQKLSKIAKHLQQGDCYQINLAQRFHAKYTGDEWSAYGMLRQANQAPFSAFVRLDETVVMSISPERFIKVDEQNVQTKPIKGTRPRGKSAVEDHQQIDSLKHAEKDRAENLMIVDLLRNDLSKHCEAGSVKVPDLFKVESFAAVHHLVSTVTGKLKEQSSSLDLLQGAFPGGSITGAPKIRAMQIIHELEPNARNIYCGSLAYFGVLGDMDSNICIRTLLCEPKDGQQQIYCWAGGGIVLDSNAQDEYQESLDKVSKILPILSSPVTQKTGVDCHE